MEFVKGFAAGQDDANEDGTPVVGDLHLAPNADLIVVQEFLHRATIALETVGALTDGEAHFATSICNFARMKAATSLAEACPFSIFTALPARKRTRFSSVSALSAS